MVQIVEQTYEEKFAMYSKLSKKELIQMLIEANRVLGQIPPQIYIPVPKEQTTPVNPYPLWKDNIIYGSQV